VPRAPRTAAGALGRWGAGALRPAAIIVHRVYDADVAGYRVLVDRLWPRGITKDGAALDEWLKDVAPSTELRRWYGHQPSRFAEFRRRYRAELEQAPASDAARHLRDLTEARLVLLTATHDIERSGALVLRGHLAAMPPSPDPDPTSKPAMHGGSGSGPN